MKPIQAIRGMNDILPQDIPYWHYVEAILCGIASRYGYQEIRFPLLEETKLFSRGIGEITDIVEKEMYTFPDRNGDSLTLRPEGTAGCVRAGIQNGLLYNQVQRLWYQGPMFRHERPQKGRYRQFHQFGIEAFGLPGPDIDAEILLLTARFWHELGIKNNVTLHLNTLGTDNARIVYRQKLIEYFSAHSSLLDEDSTRRLNTNPLRILDSKNPQLQDLISNAPQLMDYLDEQSLTHFTALRRLLDAANLEYTINPRLVRGLDYYGLTVFEWTTTSLGSQGAICGGGRYNNLVAQFGGKDTPAIGFAIGLERLIELVHNVHTPTTAPDIYLVTMGDKAQEQGLLLAEKLRNSLPKLRIILNCNGGNLATQLKRADKCQANLALIIGDEELQSASVTVKWLRANTARQEKIILTSVVDFLQKI